MFKVKYFLYQTLNSWVSLFDSKFWQIDWNLRHFDIALNCNFLFKQFIKISKNYFYCFYLLPFFLTTAATNTRMKLEEFWSKNILTSLQFVFKHKIKKDFQKPKLIKTGLFSELFYICDFNSWIYSKIGNKIECII